MTSRDDTGGVDNFVGMKRKASVVSDERKDGITADQRNAKSAKVGLGVSLHDIDLLTKIASFLPPGMALMSICVVAGRAGAGHIRQEYLTDNDEYVSHSLRTLIHRFDKAYSYSYDDLRRPWPNDRFDKCRDDIRAWMQYNDWKSRCNMSNVDRYQNFSSKIARFHETNFPFNSPSFAAALGLLEVVQYCHQRIGATPTYETDIWHSLILRLYRSSPLKTAIARGTFDVLEYILSEIPTTTDQVRAALRFCAEGLGTHTSLIRLPMKAVLALLRHDMTSSFSLSDALIFLDLSITNHNHTEEDKLSLKKTIFDLLDAGAGPFEEVSDLFRLYESMTSINTAERFRKTAELYYTTSLPIWDDIVEKMKSTHIRR